MSVCGWYNHLPNAYLAKSSNWVIPPCCVCVCVCGRGGWYYLKYIYLKCGLLVQEFTVFINDYHRNWKSSGINLEKNSILMLLIPVLQYQLYYLIHVDWNVWYHQNHQLRLVYFFFNPKPVTNDNVHLSIFWYCHQQIGQKICAHLRVQTHSTHASKLHGW